MNIVNLGWYWWKYYFVWVLLKILIWIYSSPFFNCHFYERRYCFDLYSPFSQLLRTFQVTLLGNSVILGDSCHCNLKDKEFFSNNIFFTFSRGIFSFILKVWKVFVFFFFPPFIFISWRLITLQYCSGFCHTLTWISHGFTCIPHPDPPSHLPLYPISLGLPSAPGPGTCLMHPTWTSDLFHLW